jgi:hypothetical protein
MAPYPKGHAEVVAVVREVDACRYVDKATDADRAVHGKARDRFGCQMGLRLEKIVREHERLIQIPQEISDGIADGRGKDRAIGLGHRHEDNAIDRLIKIKDDPVGVFKRIARILLRHGWLLRTRRAR